VVIAQENARFYQLYVIQLTAVTNGLRQQHYCLCYH